MMKNENVHNSANFQDNFCILDLVVNQDNDEDHKIGPVIYTLTHVRDQAIKIP